MAHWQLPSTVAAGKAGPAARPFRTKESRARLRIFAMAVEPLAIDFHVKAMAVFAVFLCYVAEKAAVRTLCLRAIVLVVTFRVALGAYVLRAFEVTTRLVPY